MELIGGGTLKTGAFTFVYRADFPNLLYRVDAGIDAHASELQVRNFYGYGNASPRDEEKEDNNYYRVNSREYFIRPGIHFHFHENISIGFAASYKHFDLRRTSGKFIGTQNLDSLQSNGSILGFGAEAEVDTRDHHVFPATGIHLILNVSNHPDPFHDGHPFQRLAGDLRLYAGTTLVRDIVFAARLAGERVHGRFPFHESAFLGGGSSLRGYFLQRFAGDASVLGSADLRISLLRMKILVPTEVGVLIIGDAGRVWVDGASPGGWHSDAGGGLWLSPLSRDVVLSVSAASSVDGLFVYGGLGFAF
jgi:outer membrane protein assembly factor BamA